jgi:DNA repair protein RadA/Sms
MTARRIGATRPQIHVVHETNIESVLWHARELHAGIVVVDSIHTAQSTTSRGQPGSDHQVKACCQLLRQFSKATETIVVAVSHVNKDGDVSGAMALEHLGDATLMLSLGIEGTDIGPPWRELRAKKNRFGSTLEVGLLQMTDRGLVAAGESDAANLAEIQKASQDRKEREDGLIPVVHELLRRYVELGGKVDADLASRVAGKVDLEMIGAVR